MKRFYSIFFFIGSLCGVAALLLFLIKIPKWDIISLDNVDYIYDKLSFHMFFLELILILVGIGAAVLAFFGYQSIKEEAVRQAVNQAVNQAVAKASDEVRAFFQTSGKPTEWDISRESPHDGSSKSEMETRDEEEESK